uniref:Uncharacterized protein n=1 Tax=Arundo donax TaxID=35708 RepID=A0A0A9FA69_ARUDO
MILAFLATASKTHMKRIGQCKQTNCKENTYEM